MTDVDPWPKPVAILAHSRDNLSRNRLRNNVSDDLRLLNRRQKRCAAYTFTLCRCLNVVVVQRVWGWGLTPRVRLEAGRFPVSLRVGSKPGNPETKSHVRQQDSKCPDISKAAVLHAISRLFPSESDIEKRALACVNSRIGRS